MATRSGSSVRNGAERWPLARRWLLVLAGSAGLAGFLVDWGIYDAWRYAGALAALRGVAVGGFLLEGLIAALTVRPWRDFFQARWPLLVLTLLLTAELAVIGLGGRAWLAPFLHSLSIATVTQAYVVLLQFFILGNMLINLQRLSSRLAQRRVRPMLVFLMAFAAVIVIGAGLLMLPRAAPRGHACSPLDALFTSTSAVCVTGLVVRDTGGDFTRLGQWIILVLIQLGGLGIMSITATLALLLGRGIGVREGSLLREIFQIDFVDQVGRTLRFIVLFTVATELVGAALLYAGFADAIPARDARAFSALFHAVSAFCNAGFSTWTDSLCGFADVPLVHLTVVALLITGGLGFSVVGNLLFFLRGRLQGVRSGAGRRLNVQTRLVLRSTLILVAGGALLLAILEWDGAFAGRPTGERLGLALFQAATPRTAGFTTVDLAHLSQAALVLQILLMFIGASSGSTGGGVKVTTIAVLWSHLRAIVAGHPHARLHDREISTQTVRQATFVVMANVLVGTAGMFLLLLIEGCEALPAAYEVYSALGTVGLSLGLTPGLSAAGKLLIVLLMFYGRVGPLAIAYGVVRPTREHGVRLPASRLMIG